MLVIALVALGGAGAWLVGALGQRVREVATTALSTALQRDVVVGRVSGDPWRGVTFEDVSIPALRAGEAPVLEARRITVYLDARGVLRDVLGRAGLSVAVTANIAQVTVEQSVLRVVHGARGWNFTELLPAGPAGQRTVPLRFAGRVIMLDGVVLLTDRVRIAPRVFHARFSDVNGTADFSGVPRLALRASFVEDRAARRIPGRLSGAYRLDRGILDIDVEATGADAAPWGQYFLTTPAFRVAGGQADLKLHVLRMRGATRSSTDFDGRLTVRDGAAAFPGRPAAVSRVQGEILLNNRLVSTPGLRGVLNGAQVEVRGEVSFYGEPQIDVAARSGAASLTALGRLFFPSLAPRLSGVARGEVRVTGPVSALRVWARVDSARGQVDRKPFEHAAGELSLYGGMVSFTGGRGRLAGAQVAGSGLWTLGGSQYFLTLDVQGADAALVKPWAPAALPPFSGRVDGTLIAARGNAGVRIAGQASLDNGRIRGVSLDGFDASFRSDQSGIAIDHVRVRQGAITASGTGRVEANGAIRLDALAHVGDLSALPLPRGRYEMRGQADLRGRIEGTVQSPRFAGFAQLLDGRVGEMPFNSASGRITLSQTHVQVDGGHARSGFARVIGTALVNWGRHPALSLDLSIERAPADALVSFAGLPLRATGRVDGAVRVEGSPTQPVAAGSLSLRDANVAGQPLDEVAAAFRWDGRRLTVAGGSVRRGGSMLHVAGTFDRLTGLAFDVGGSGLDLRDAPLPPIGATRVDGHVDLAGRITGPVSSPTWAIDVASSDLRLNGLRFDHAGGTIRWVDRTLRLEPLALRVNGERYELQGGITLGPIPNVQLVSTVTNGRLSTLLGLGGARLGVPLDGTVSGTAALDGPVGNPVARLDLTLASGRLGDHPLTGRADLTLSNGSVSIEDFEFLLGQGRIAATGRYELRGTSQIEVSGAELALDVLRPLFRLRQPLLGQLDFTIQLGGTLASPELGFDLEITRGGVEGATFDSLVASAFYRDGQLQLVQGLLAQNGHKLRASGSVPFNPKSLRFDDKAPLDFRLTLADVNLGLLRLLTDRVEDAKGAIEGGLTLSGTIATPRLSGEVRVDDGAMRVRGMQTPIESMVVGLRFEDNIIRTQGTARLGGGQVQLDGAMRLAFAPPGGVILEVPSESPLVLQASNPRITVQPFVDARFNGAVRLWGTLGDPKRPPTLDGRIVASEGTLAVSAAGGAGGGGGRAAPLVFQSVQLAAGRDLVVRVGDLRFGLRPEGSLLLTGSMAAPRLEGTLEAQRGTVTAMGNVFDLQEGTATFRPALGLRPQVSSKAVTRVGTTVITLMVRGVAPDALTLDLESDPPLPRADIVALLGEQAGITQLLAGDIGGLLRAEISRRLFAPVTLAIGRALGLSELTIVYDFQRPLRLTAGKALLSNLYLTASTIFDEGSRWLLSLEYRFAPGWQVAFTVEPEGQRTVIFWYTTRF
jgi:translocation and assembly module TamB